MQIHPHYTAIVINWQKKSRDKAPSLPMHDVTTFPKYSPSAARSPAPFGASDHTLPPGAIFASRVEVTGPFHRPPRNNQTSEYVSSFSPPKRNVSVCQQTETLEKTYRDTSFTGMNNSCPTSLTRPGNRSNFTDRNRVSSVVRYFSRMTAYISSTRSEITRCL